MLTRDKKKRYAPIPEPVKEKLISFLAESIVDSSDVQQARIAWNAAHPNARGHNLSDFETKRAAAVELLRRVLNDENLNDDGGMVRLSLVLGS